MVYHIVGSNTLHNSFRCRNEGLAIGVVLWINPLAFHDSPERLGDVEMRRVRGEIEDEESSFLPVPDSFLERLAPVYAGVVEHDESHLLDCLGIIVEEVHHHLCVDRPYSLESVVLVVPACHAEHAYARSLLGWDEDILTLQVPCIGHIAAGAEMGLVTVKEVDETAMIKIFKFLQNLDLVCVDLRRGLSPWAKSYSLISCAITAKKRLRVEYPTLRPLSSSHSDFASLSLWRCFLTFSSMAARSSSVSAGFLLWTPVFVRRPSTPFSLKVRIQLNTDAMPHSKAVEMVAAVLPSAFMSMALQRVRYACDSPLRKPASSADLYSSVNSMMFTCLIVAFFLDYNNGLSKHRAKYII